MVFMLLLLVTILMGLVIIYTMIWWFSVEEGDMKIKFSQFLSFYAICPSKFQLGDCHVSYCRRGYNYIWIYFGYLDLMRYKFWCKRQKKVAAKTSKVNITMAFLEDMKRNINRYIDDM